MINENHNKTVNWRSKLDELQSLGETTPDKNVLWEKLHKRLGGKKRNTKTAWYWIAAACLLLALMIPFLISNKENKGIKENVVQKQSQNQNKSAEQLAKKYSVKIVNPPLIEKNKVTAFENKKRIIIPAISPNVKNSIRVTDPVSKADSIAQTANIVPPDNNVVTATITPAKKTLRVVHVNELGDPIEASPDVARTADVHSFQFKFGNGEVYINSPAASKTMSYSLLKTKASPN